MNHKRMFARRIILLLGVILFAACTPTSSTTVPELPTSDLVLPSATLAPLPATPVPPTATTPLVKIPAKYAHPEILVDAGWVADHLSDPTVRIVDAREPLEGALYQTGHIPGAVFVDIFSELCCPSKIMAAQPFAELMGKLSIGDNTTVVVYDTDGGLWAARLWWALKYYGHDDVKMLNGGLLQWVSNSHPLEAETPKVSPETFHSKVQPQWLATIDEVKKAIDDPDIVLLDALTLPNYLGDLDTYERPGHIATALSFPAPDTIDGVTRMVLSPEELSRMLMRLNLDPEKRVITHCGGGYYGAHTAFVLYLMGFENVGLYEGSLMEWASDPSNPMEVEP